MLIITILLSRLANRVKVAGKLQCAMWAQLGPNQFEIDHTPKRIDARDFHARVVAQAKFLAAAAAFLFACDTSQ
jgi:hypothetical protein